MTITKQQSLDKIEILMNGAIQVRYITTICEENVILSNTYLRKVYEKNSDISDEPILVQQIASVVWGIQ